MTLSLLSPLPIKIYKVADYEYSTHLRVVTKCKESLCIICKSPRSLSDHMLSQADPKSAQRKDDDGRLPIHWAASSNQHAIALLLSQQKIFDPNVEVSLHGRLGLDLNRNLTGSCFEFLGR